jgi:hypothetical protein
MKLLDFAILRIKRHGLPLVTGQKTSILAARAVHEQVRASQGSIGSRTLTRQVSLTTRFAFSASILRQSVNFGRARLKTQPTFPSLSL